MTSPHIDLDQLEAAAKAATPGPWRVGKSHGANDRYCVAQDCRDPLFTAECGPSKANATHIAAANPAVVLELVARLRRAEAGAARYRWMREADWDDIERVYWCHEVQSAGSPDACLAELDNQIDRELLTTPNDPLDDVLPLPAERAPESMAQQLKDDLDDLFIATSPLWETPEEAQAALDKAREQRRQSRQPKILPDNFPKSLDLDDTEGGSHD